MDQDPPIDPQAAFVIAASCSRVLAVMDAKTCSEADTAAAALQPMDISTLLLALEPPALSVITRSLLRALDPQREAIRSCLAKMRDDLEREAMGMVQP